jgi:hypothetical protein
MRPNRIFPNGNGLNKKRKKKGFLKKQSGDGGRGKKKKTTIKKGSIYRLNNIGNKTTTKEQ